MNKTQIILNLIDKGMTAKEISEVVNCHIQLPYGVARRYGKTIAKANISALIEYDEQIRYGVSIGKTHREIADAIGSNRESVAYYCKTRNLKTPKDLEAQVYHRRHSDDYIRESVTGTSGGLLEYVSGYTRKEDPIIVRCLVCGNEFKRAAQGILYKGSIKCPCCEGLRKEKEKKERQAEQERRAEVFLKSQHNKAVALFIDSLKNLNACPVCGKTISKKKYCSQECRKKATNKRHDVRRRAKIQQAMVDRDITVEGLYKRDKGVCYLCGGKCDYEDYVVRDGAFITGDWYPSIDHVVPLAKGGKHSWSNVRLAHFRCNTIKRDNLNLSPAGQKNPT